MWTIRWDENEVIAESVEGVIEIINSIHHTHINRFPVIVQIETSSGNMILKGT